jgi:hypothetical protein
MTPPGIAGSVAGLGWMSPALVVVVLAGAVVVLGRSTTPWASLTSPDFGESSRVSA